MDRGASHFCNKQLYLDAKYLYGGPFREFIDFQGFSKLCDWNQSALIGIAVLIENLLSYSLPT
ncbi:MAG: hypothetical protein EWV73_07390 [Microcystis wesenbergii Mw_QC_B_20070930_S4D]|nr:MAG: hypothetical protein EWV73_07390 [Microcystis wesenbergii Mw_QC_B_20070930_S4D]